MPPDPQPNATDATGPPSWMAPFKPVVPDHELIRRIGGGSYGDVWLARNVVGTWRAVKVVFRDRFLDARPYERELNGIQKFEPLSRSNEGFIDILQIGRNDEAGYFYYVMELADDAITPAFQRAEADKNVGVTPAADGSETGGPTGMSALRDAGFQPAAFRHSRTGTESDSPTGKSALQPDTYVPLTLGKALLQRGRLPVNECLELGLTLNLALGHLHRAGLIHRDIKPSNIIFVGGVPKLADIGLVIETSEARSYVGTEGFIPPEGPTSPQADLYSLGKVLYEAGMGKNRKDFPEPFTHIASAPDSEQLLEFNAILLKACAANVTDRYQSAEAMNVDLALLKSGGSVRRQRKLAGQLRLVQRAVIAVTVLATLIAAGWLWQAQQTRLVRDLATERARLAQENQERLFQSDFANGLREMEGGDIGSAMVWLADGLKYATNSPAQAEMYRLRLSLLLQQHPRLLAVTRLITNPTNQFEIELSQNGRRMVVTEDRRRTLWDLAVPPRPLLALPDEKAWPNLAVSPDGQRLLFSSRSRSQPRQEIWTIDVTGGVQVTRMNAGVLKHLRFVLGGKSIVGLDTNLAMILLDAGSGERVRELTRFESPPETTMISDRGDRLGFWFSNRVVRVWELPSGRKVGESRFEGIPSSIDLSGDGRRLHAFWGRPMDDGLSSARILIHRLPMQILDVASGASVGPLRIPLAWNVRGLPTMTSSDGRLVAVGDFTGQVQVVNEQDGNAVGPMLRHEKAIIGLRFSADGARLATLDRSATVRVFDARLGQALLPSLSQQTMAKAWGFVLNGAGLMIVGVDGLMRTWDLTSAEGTEATLYPAGIFQGMSFSPDGTYFLARSVKATQVWSTRDWRLTASIENTSGRSGASVFSPDSRYVAVADRSRGGRVWEAQTGAPAGPPLRHGTNSVFGIAFTPDQRLVATAGAQDQAVRIWDWKEGKEVRPPLLHSGQVQTVWFCAKGSRLATISFEKGRGRGTLWDWEKGNITFRSPSTSEPQAGWLQLPNRDGTQLLITGPEPNKPLLVDAFTGRSLPSKIAHEGALGSAGHFSADGRWILTGANDNTVRIWNAPDGTPALPPLHLEGASKQGLFSPDSRMVITLTLNGAIRYWDVADGTPLSPSLSLGASSFDIHPDGGILALRLHERNIAIHQLAKAIPADMLNDFVALTAGRRLGVDGRMEWLSSEELLALADRLRSTYPDRFALSSTRLARWHQAQVTDVGTLARLDSSRYHLERWLELEPGNPEARAIEARLASRRIPPRDPGAPARLIDLSDNYTQALNALPDGDLDELPRGVQHLGGTEFDVRGLLALGYPQAAGDQPSPEPLRVGNIRVAQTCQRLHFLQACRRREGIEGREAARFVIHYADGSQRVQPLLFGRHTRDWLRIGTSADEVTEATLAWMGPTDPARWNGEAFRLYKMTWENPTPSVAVHHIDFEVGDLIMRPFVVAITAE